MLHCSTAKLSFSRWNNFVELRDTEFLHTSVESNIGLQSIFLTICTYNIHDIFQVFNKFKIMFWGQQIPGYLQTWNENLGMKNVQVYNFPSFHVVVRTLSKDVKKLVTWQNVFVYISIC